MKTYIVTKECWMTGADGNGALYATGAEIELSDAAAVYLLASGQIVEKPALSAGKAAKAEGNAGD